MVATKSKMVPKEGRGLIGPNPAALVEVAQLSQAQLSPPSVTDRSKTTPQNLES